MCGGTSTRWARWQRGEGLSPRVRGNHDALTVRKALRGSIPACAGEPRAGSSGVAPQQVYPRACAGEPGRTPWPAVAGKVYPRVCGGTVCAATRRSRPTGLSPRVRGNRAGGLRGIVQTGSIPACAGEPSGRQAPPPSTRVYPRVCGGTIRGHRGGIAGGGLSPRVRGNRRGSGGRAPASGSIPACAGEPPPEVSFVRFVRVYPRVCGGTIAAITP